MKTSIIKWCMALFAMCGGVTIWAEEAAPTFPTGMTVLLDDGTSIAITQAATGGATAWEPLSGNASAAKYAERVDRLVWSFAVEQPTNGVQLALRAVKLTEALSGIDYTRMELTVTNGSNEGIAVDKIVMLEGEASGVISGNTDGAVLVNDDTFTAIEHPMAKVALNTFTAESATVTYNSNTVLNTIWDLPVKVTSDGNVTVTIQWTNGYPHGTKIQKVEVIGKTIKDEHPGFTGGSNDANVYTLADVPAGDYTLRVTFGIESSIETLNTAGTVTLGNATFRKANVLSGYVPVSETLAAGKSLTCSLVQGTVDTTVAGSFRRGFHTYLDAERAHPYRVFPHYNSWYDLCIGRKDAENPLDRLTEEKCLASLRAIRAGLAPYGVSLVSYLWDDGWDNWETLWDFHEGFKNGFTALATEAQKDTGASIGVWMSPVGGYGTSKEERVKAAKAAGVIAQDATQMTLSSPPTGTDENGKEISYYRAFTDRCLQMITKYQMNLFKFDRMGSGEDSIGAATKYAADLRAVGNMIAELRNAKQDVFINTTVGTWASPFWMMWSDSIWRGGGDWETMDTKRNAREGWMTYRDKVIYERFVQDAPLFPLNSLMMHGLIVATSNSYNGNNPAYVMSVIADGKEAEATKSFANEVWMSVAYGTNLQEYYLCPEEMRPSWWEILADGIKWLKANEETLRDVHWVGGDPAAGKTMKGGNGSYVNFEGDLGEQAIYGYASLGPKKGILILRNPANVQKEITFNLADLLEVPPARRTDTPIAIKTVYASDPDNSLGSTAFPAFATWGDTSEQTLTLEPYGVRLVEITTATTATWIGGGENANWSTVANWKDGIVAEEGCDVILPGEATISMDVDASVRTLTFSSGGTLTLGGTKTLSVTAFGEANPNEITINDGAGLTLDTRYTSPITYKQKVVCNGTLTTYGTVSLNNSATNSNGNNFNGKLVVASGSLTFNSYHGNGISGEVTIKEGATLSALDSDSADENNPVTFNVYGELAFGSTRWAMQKATFNLYGGAKVTGTGDTYGAIDIAKENVTEINILPYGDEKEVTLSASWRLRKAKGVEVNIPEGMTLHLSGDKAKKDNVANTIFTFKGLGTVNLSGTNNGTGSITISEGVTAVVVGGTPFGTGLIAGTGAVVIDADVTIPLATVNGTDAYTLSINADKTLTIDAGEAGGTLTRALSGEGAWAKDGSGVLNLGALITTAQGTTVKAGTLKYNNGYAIGGSDTHKIENGTGAYNVVTVADGATLDYAGVQNAHTDEVILMAGATLANSGSGITNGQRQLRKITLKGNATLDLTNGMGLVTGNYGSTELALNGHTLTKKGNGDFWLRSNNTISLTSEAATLGGIELLAGKVYTFNGKTLTGTGELALSGTWTDQKLDFINVWPGSILFCGAEGSFTANKTYAKNFKLGWEDAEKTTGGLTITGGTAGSTQTFTGTLLGDAPFKVAGEAPAEGHTFVFTGNTSGYTGTVIVEGKHKVVFEQTLGAGFKIGSIAQDATLVLPAGTCDAGRLEALLTAAPVKTVYTLAADATIEGTIQGVDAADPSTALTGVAEDSSVTISSSYAPGATYAGKAWWWDYEFNDNAPLPEQNDGGGNHPTVANSGTDKGPLFLEGTINAETPLHVLSEENKAIYFRNTPYRKNGTTSYGTAMTAVMYCQPASVNDTSTALDNRALLSFGSSTSTDQCAITLATGTIAQNEMLLVLTKGKALYTEHGIEAGILARLSVPNATVTPHLYAFTYEVKEGSTQIDVYVDGKLRSSRTIPAEITLGPGFQIGGIHGGVGNSNLKRTETGDGYVDFLRVTNTILSTAAMAALRDAYPYTPTAGIYQRTLSSTNESWIAEGSWYAVTNGELAASGVAYPPTGAALQLITEGTAPLILTYDLSTLPENIEEDTVRNLSYESLVVSGTAPLTITSAEGREDSCTFSDVTLDADLTVDYDTVKLSTALVNLTKQEGFPYPTLTIACDALFGRTLKPTTYGLTGVTAVDYGEAICVTPAAEDERPTHIISVTAGRNTNTSSYEVVVTVPELPSGEAALPEGTSDAAVQAILAKATDAKVNKISSVVVKGTTATTLETHTINAVNLFSNILDISDAGEATITYDFGMTHVALETVTIDDTEVRAIVITVKVQNAATGNDAIYTPGTKVRLKDVTYAYTVFDTDPTLAAAKAEGALDNAGGTDTRWIVIPLATFEDITGAILFNVEAVTP